MTQAPDPTEVVPLTRTLRLSRRITRIPRLGISDRQGEEKRILHETVHTNFHRQKTPESTLEIASHIVSSCVYIIIHDYYLVLKDMIAQSTTELR